MINLIKLFSRKKEVKLEKEVLEIVEPVNDLVGLQREIDLIINALEVFRRKITIKEPEYLKNLSEPINTDILFGNTLSVEEKEERRRNYREQIYHDQQKFDGKQSVRIKGQFSSYSIPKALEIKDIRDERS